MYMKIGCFKGCKIFELYFKMYCQNIFLIFNYDIIEGVYFKL